MKKLMMNKTYENTPHMEYFFDEINETLTIRCPLTEKAVNVEAVRRAYDRLTPFVEVIHCDGCGDVIHEEEEHLNRLNKIYYYY